MTAAFLVNLVVNGLVEGLVISLPALALTLVMGICRFPNASAGDVMTAGAYGALAMQAASGASLVVAGLGAMLATALLSVLSYELVFRRLARAPAVASLLAAIGVAFMLRSALLFSAGHEPRTYDLPLVRAWDVGGVKLLPTDMAVAAVAAAAVAVVFTLLARTDAGRRLRALADNEELARLGGIRGRRLMWLLWAGAGALCALGGVLIGVKGVLIPEIGWDLLLPAFAAMILGGVGSPLGAFVAALVMGVAQELSVPLVGPSYKIVVAFVVMVAVLLVRPRGLFGLQDGVR